MNDHRGDPGERGAQWHGTAPPGLKGARGEKGEKGEKGKAAGVLLPYLWLWASIAIVGAIFAYGIREVQQTARAQQLVLAETREGTVRNCRGVTVLNAFIQVAFEESPQPERRQLVKRIFPVLDCEQSARGGAGIPLRSGERTKYIDLIREGRLPVVSGGKVVGSRPFPPGGPDGLSKK